MSRQVLLLVVGAIGCDRVFGLQQVKPMSDGGDAMMPDYAFVDVLLIGAPIKSVAAGSTHTCAISQLGGMLRCWGSATNGELGYGNLVAIGDDEPAGAEGDVPVGTSVDSVSAGESHTCAVTTSRSVRCWGNVGSGRLGYGFRVSTNVGDDEPASTPGDVEIGELVDAVAAGRAHTCALSGTGQVYCWGYGTLGALGYGGTWDVGDGETPFQQGAVATGFAVTKAIAAGADHSCALSNTGLVRCWGAGQFGRLGYGNQLNIGDSEAPSSAGDVPLGTDVLKLAAGGEHTCALTSAHAVMCWGHAASGALGYGNTNDIGDNEFPTGQVSLGGTAIDIAAGGAHTCAVITDGTLRCWGANTYGQLGIASTENIGDNELPSSIPPVDVGAQVTNVWAGRDHTCVKLATNQLRCWGAGVSGALGYGNTNNIGDDEVPRVAGDVLAF